MADLNGTKGCRRAMEGRLVFSISFIFGPFVVLNVARRWKLSSIMYLFPICALRTKWAYVNVSIYSFTISCGEMHAEILLIIYFTVIEMYTILNNRQFFFLFSSIRQCFSIQRLTCDT